MKEQFSDPHFKRECVKRSLSLSLSFYHARGRERERGHRFVRSSGRLIFLNYHINYTIYLFIFILFSYFSNSVAGFVLDAAGRVS